MLFDVQRRVANLPVAAAAPDGDTAVVVVGVPTVVAGNHCPLGGLQARTGVLVAGAEDVRLGAAAIQLGRVRRVSTTRIRRVGRLLAARANN